MAPVDSLASACILARTSLSDASCACATSFASLGKFRTYRASANSSSLSGRGEGKTSSLGSASATARARGADLLTAIAPPRCVALVGVLPRRRSLAVASGGFGGRRICSVFVGCLANCECVVLPDLHATAIATITITARAPASLHLHHA